MNARHGLTLIELLFSLALLGSLSVVAVQWTTMTAERHRVQSTADAWHHAAERALDLIERDLLTGDRSSQGGESRAILGGWSLGDDGSLSIDTRVQGLGAVQRRYELVDDSLVSILWQEEREHLRSPLLGRVEEFRVIVSASDSSTSSMMEITIRGPNAWFVARLIDLGVAGDE